MNTTQRTALVTAIGSFSADAVIRTLRQEGWRIIGTDIYEADWVAASLMVDAFYQAPYASEEEKYIDLSGTSAPGSRSAVSCLSSMWRSMH